MNRTLSSTKSNLNACSTFARESTQSKDKFISAKKAVTLNGFNRYNLPGDKKQSVSFTNESNLQHLKQ